MPTIPLNQLAFPLEWLVLAMVKNDGACRHLRTKTRHSYPARLCPEAEFSGSDIAFLIAAKWNPILLSPLSRSNGVVFARCRRQSASHFAKSLRNAFVARRDRQLTWNSEAV